MKKTFELYFLHANGFPSSVYKKFLSYLSNDFAVSSSEMLGHHLHYSVDDNLESLTNEVIDSIEVQYQTPILAVGHSLGGTLFYMAAKKRPELFAGIVMMDSLIVSGLEAMLFSLAKSLNIFHRFGPAALSKGQRSIWPDRQAAIDYFSAKKLFAHFDEDCLNNYIDYGMETLESGEKKLRFDPEIEVAIFNHYPHVFGKGSWELSVPTMFLYGKDSNVIYPRHVKHLIKNAKMQVREMPGGHMFPLEIPRKTAEMINAELFTMLSLKYDAD